MTLAHCRCRDRNPLETSGRLYGVGLLAGPIQESTLGALREGFVGAPSQIHLPARRRLVGRPIRPGEREVLWLRGGVLPGLFCCCAFGGGLVGLLVEGERFYFSGTLNPRLCAASRITARLRSSGTFFKLSTLLLRTRWR